MVAYPGEPLNILHTIGLKELYPIIRVHFCVAGSFDETRFEDALMKCAQVVPELFCKYVLADNSFVSVVDDLEGVVYKKLDPDIDISRWDLFMDPQIRVYLNHHGEEADVTIFFSHILTDGAGAKQLLQLLATAYNTGTVEGIVNYQDIDWLRKLLAEHQVEVKKETDHPAKPLTMPKLTSDKEQQIRRTRRLALSKKLTAQLIKTSHKTGVTINDLLMAAYGQAVQRFSATDRISLACPTDMRKFIPGPKELRVANHTSRYNISVHSDVQQPFVQAVRAVHDTMAANKQEFQCLASVKTLVDNYDRYSLAKLQQICEDNYHVRTISYTNFGIVDFAFAGCQISDFDMLGSYRRAPMFQVAVSTYEAQLIFAFAMIGTAEEERVGNVVMLTMKDLLEKYVLKFGENQFC
jgi:NRPS condensation-like uncharacterized protein